jgi:hypothetical protein
LATRQISVDRSDPDRKNIATVAARSKPTFRRVAEDQRRACFIRTAGNEPIARR